MLVPDSVTPLYLQLEEILRQEILSGSRREGDKLPTENELVEQYKVSRITVRRAVEELCKEGLVVRHPGKGTFVTGVVMRNDLEEPRGWTENAVANGYRPSTVCTDLSMVPGAEVCRLFELKHGEERYCCARRVRALNGKPAVYELDYFPPQDAEFLTKELLSGSVFRLLRQWKSCGSSVKKKRSSECGMPVQKRQLRWALQRDSRSCTLAPAIWTAKTGWC